ncbi:MULTISPECIES: F0F1 ATP synthase subunit delta [Desulfofundulus]|jgi:F-type H+-transporting ATPase subunit delta|uniref:ATP synthase subunit delta n=1 Tax=Desulfofundulus australicus DSM 11792 TaxID=1121425 RepID=A0A1M4YIS9_9FIRM|nr:MULTISPECIES: F0F1 ATP synthase subunit delta [Desulfofundulus]MBE3586829.1 F0F1 ATP synthase subunit delta [Thermoanaerobacter sp.]MCS5695482.1 F0F1 ATP synthase subunit delta [Desulfofundulus thermocisternus]MDK2888665.1 F-type H+-transporting ATPase subunit delta [Thermoanaerobacter sp.]SHF05611.1 ATP synthase F1 subcomplex delta subunit [Desulfofundulus australicus DSM 11792]
MLKGAVAQRYAQALYELAETQGLVDQVEQELKSVEEIVASSREFQKVLYHPRITAQEKKDVLKNIFSGKVSPITENFLFLLVDRQREAFLSDIVDYYISLANRARNIVKAEVTSAIELTREEKKKLGEVLNRITRKKVQTVYSVDPALIGGVVVRIGDRVIDGSLRTRLASMREHLRQIS